MPPRPPPPSKRKSKFSAKSSKAQVKNKFNLTETQRVKVEIIDWKRWAVRSLLFPLYVIIAHMFAYCAIVINCRHTISQLGTLRIAFGVFLADLFLYFYGANASVRAISFAWNPIKFAAGIAAVAVAIIINIICFFVGASSRNSIPKKKQDEGEMAFANETELCVKFHSNEYKESDFANYTMLQQVFSSFAKLCAEKRLVEASLLCMPLVLAPIAFIGIILASFAAFKALYVVPKRISDPNFDAAWLEPYETYDFYVGRNIPRIPGYDQAYEGNVVDTSKFLESDESEEEATNEEVKKAAGHKKGKKAKAHQQGDHHEGQAKGESH